MVVALGGLLGTALTAWHPGELTDRRDKTVDERADEIVRDLSQRVLPETLFTLAEIGRLAHEGGAMQPPQGGKEGVPVRRT